MFCPTPQPDGFFGRCQRGMTDLCPAPAHPVTTWHRDGRAQVNSAKRLVEIVCHREGDNFVAFHGTLLNANKLCRELDTPTEISTPALIYLAWRRWGYDSINRMDGQFALVLRDSSQDQDAVYLYSDRSAAHPLYYTRLPEGGVAFASRLQLIKRYIGCPVRLSRHGLHEYLRFLDISPPNTLYDGVLAVVSGEMTLIRGGELSTVQLAKPTLPVCDHFDTAVRELEKRLHESVSARIQDASSPAAFLSGGVDSALICAIARRHRADIVAVTVGFDTPELDETPVAQRIAQHLRVEHRVLRFTQEEMLRAFSAFNAGAEQPTADPACAPTLLAFEYCARRHDVMLDGIGADDLVGIMPPRHTRVAIEYGARLPFSLRQTLVRGMRRLPLLREYTPILDFTHPAELLIRWRGFRADEIELLTGEKVSLENTRFYQVFARYPPHAHFERYTALVQCGPSDRLHQAAMMVGLPVRLPYLDKQVAAFIESLPQHYRYQEDEPKRILRALLARHVPRQLWDGPKHGFDFPFVCLLAARDFSLVRRYLLEGDQLRAYLPREDLIKSYASRFIAGEATLGFRVWALVVLAAWLESHLARAQAESTESLPRGGGDIFMAQVSARHS